MEALNTDSSSVLGWSFGVASPNEAGNVAVFTQRIINYITSLFAGATTLKYSTASLVNGAWTWSTPILRRTATSSCRRRSSSTRATNPPFT